jgi:hypothetical protein
MFIDVGKISRKKNKYVLKKKIVARTIAEIAQSKSLPCHMAENFSRSGVNYQLVVQFKDCCSCS